MLYEGSDYRAVSFDAKDGSKWRVQMCLFGSTLLLQFYAANVKTDLNCCRADDLSGSTQLVPAIKTKT
jgi:hypothetical protein